MSRTTSGPAPASAPGRPRTATARTNTRMPAPVRLVGGAGFAGAHRVGSAGSRDPQASTPRKPRARRIAQRDREQRAAEDDVRELIRHTDGVAEVQNTIRRGMPVQLESFHPVPVDGA